MNSTPFKAKIQLLSSYYFGIIVGFVASFLLILFRVIEFGVPKEAISAAMERYAIVFTLIAIPLALKFFAYKTKKRTFDSEKKAFKAYAGAFYFRLYILCLVVALNQLLFAISRNMNFFWLTVVVLIVFMFCKPSFNEYAALLTPSEDKNEE